MEQMAKALLEREELAGLSHSQAERVVLAILEELEEICPSLREPVRLRQRLERASSSPGPVELPRLEDLSLSRPGPVAQPQGRVVPRV